MTDYATELLGGTTQAQSGGHDYASELLGPRLAENPGGAVTGRIVLKGTPQSGGVSAGFGALTKSAMVDDQQTKIRILANNLFPGERDAVERFGVINGDIVYVGKDDKLYRAEPGGVKSFAANMVGNLPTIAGGTAGGIAGAPLGPAGMIGLSALGAAGGKGIQQSIANVAFDEPQTVGGNIGGMAKEGAFGAAGAAGGLLFQRFLNRNVARDLSRLDPDKTAELSAKASAQGVDLNAAQLTNLPSLKGRAEALARIPASADDMNSALERTRQQAGAAADRFVQGYQPTVSSVRGAGEAGRTGAETILERIAQDRSVAAKPWYDRAFKATIDPRDEALQKLAETPAFKKGFERAVRIASNEGIDLGNEANNMRVLHYIKMGIDDMLDPKVMAREGIGSTEQRGILSVKNQLLKIMDDASPDYARARSIYGHYMPTLKAHREGTLGAIANLDDKDLGSAARAVFNPKNSPEDVRQLRSMFYRYDQGEKWKALTKGYLQDTLEQSSRQFKSGPGVGRAVTWRYALLGDPKQAANLRAAMTDEQWKGFGDLMDVLEAAGRVTGTGNSITMPMQEAAAALRSESGSGTLASVLKPRQRLIDWLEEARLGKHARKQVEILNDPEALTKLKELRSLSPNDRRFIQGFSTLFGLSASPE